MFLRRGHAWWGKPSIVEEGKKMACLAVLVDGRKGKLRIGLAESLLASPIRLLNWQTEPKRLRLCVYKT